MEFKGTKGEWYVVGSEPAEIATDKKSICFVGIQDYFNKDIEQRANAKLIAAAPELLKALIKSVESMEIADEVEFIDEIKQAKIAINKALK
jgi:hypothetical protein